MDHDSLLQDFRKNYFLGNYSKNIEQWKQLDSNDLGEHTMTIDFLVSRSLIAQTKVGQKIGLGDKKDQLNDQFKGITNLVNEYLGPILLNQKTPEQSKEDFISFAENKGKSPVHYLVYLYLGLNSGDLESVMQSEDDTNHPDFPFKKDLEIYYVQLLAYLQANNHEQAKKKLNQMKIVEDEDILTLLGQVYYNMHIEKQSTSLQYVEELKERFGDSAFLINLKISLLMQQQKFSVALQLAQQLYTLLTTKENVFNKSELEICLTHLINISDILNKPTDEYIENLYKLNEDGLNIQRAQQQSAIFDDFASKLSKK